MRRVRRDIGWLVLVFSLAVSACGDNEESAEQAAADANTAEPAAATANAPAAPQPATPAAPAAPVWSYSPIGKRDPFRSYLANEEETEGPEQKLTETEKYELDQYRLTGLVTGTAQPSAMVEDPAGDGHTLRIGARLGRNGGRVTRIDSKGIVVTEEFRAPTGERVRVPIHILLPKPELELGSKEP